MKYPKAQYMVLLQILKQLDSYVDIINVNLHQLHYLVYQQLCASQPHNQLYINSTTKQLARYHAIENLTDKSSWLKLIHFDFEFQLYPDGCNDNHVETAMKKAITEYKTA